MSAASISSTATVKEMPSAATTSGLRRRRDSSRPNGSMALSGRSASLPWASCGAHWVRSRPAVKCSPWPNTTPQRSSGSRSSSP